nr:phosphate ABC transporter, permease protein PstA [Lysobacter sp.]
GAAHASALVLIALLVLINLATSWTADRWLHRRIIRA